MSDPTWELKSLEHELATARARIAELTKERDLEARRKEFERREHYAARAENARLREALERARNGRQDYAELVEHYRAALERLAKIDPLFEGNLPFINASRELEARIAYAAGALAHTDTQDLGWHRDGIHSHLARDCPEPGRDA